MLKKREKELAKKARKEFLDDKTFEESPFDVYETETIPVVDAKNANKRKRESTWKVLVLKRKKNIE